MTSAGESEWNWSFITHPHLRIYQGCGVSVPGADMAPIGIILGSFIIRWRYVETSWLCIFWCWLIPMLSKALTTFEYEIWLQPWRIRRISSLLRIAPCIYCFQTALQAKARSRCYIRVIFPLTHLRNSHLPPQKIRNDHLNMSFNLFESFQSYSTQTRYSKKKIFLSCISYLSSIQSFSWGGIRKITAGKIRISILDIRPLLFF